MITYKQIKNEEIKYQAGEITQPEWDAIMAQYDEENDTI